MSNLRLIHLSSVENHPASRAFLSLARFWRTCERFCMNRGRSLLSMRGTLLRYSFQPRPLVVRLLQPAYDHWFKYKWMLTLEKN